LVNEARGVRGPGFSSWTRSGGARGNLSVLQPARGVRGSGFSSRPRSGGVRGNLSVLRAAVEYVGLASVSGRNPEGASGTRREYVPVGSFRRPCLKRSPKPPPARVPASRCARQSFSSFPVRKQEIGCRCTNYSPRRLFAEWPAPSSPRRRPGPSVFPDPLTTLDSEPRPTPSQTLIPGVDPQRHWIPAFAGKPAE
jgi:hypothetical protein